MAQTIEVERPLHEVLAEIRYEISKTQLKKTGYNAHLKYNYFELGDFLPKALELFAKYKVCTIFNIEMINNIETATLKLIGCGSQLEFTTPTAGVPNMQGVFELGSKHTYCRRYLYVNLLELTENDIADQINDGKPEPRATPEQIKQIKELFDFENQVKMLKFFGIERLEDLSIKNASEVIRKKKARNGTAKEGE